MESKPFTKLSLAQANLNNLKSQDPSDNLNSDDEITPKKKLSKTHLLKPFKKLIVSPFLNSKFSPSVSIRESPVIKQRQKPWLKEGEQKSNLKDKKVLLEKLGKKTKINEKIEVINENRDSLFTFYQSEVLSDASKRIKNKSMDNLKIEEQIGKLNTKFKTNCFTDLSEYDKDKEQSNEYSKDDEIKEESKDSKDNSDVSKKLNKDLFNSSAHTLNLKRKPKKAKNINIKQRVDKEMFKEIFIEDTDSPIGSKFRNRFSDNYGDNFSGPVRKFSLVSVDQEPKNQVNSSCNSSNNLSSFLEEKLSEKPTTNTNYEGYLYKITSKYTIKKRYYRLVDKDLYSKLT